jgi:protein gp37
MVEEAICDMEIADDPTYTPWPWPNVWLGATVVNQEEADRDIPKLLAVPARIRFLSIEPMLGPVDVRFAFSDARVIRCPQCMFGTNRLDHGPCPNDGETLRNDPGIDWIIAGGESGPHARPAHPDWFRSLRSQCAAAGVAFHLKQITERGRKVPMDQWPADLRVQEFPHG